ncbi:1-phosphatidylinositol 4,5-bisphosphate phosphodiesterase eta-2-like isoform X2 [Paramacrobiotus metropolitanus]|uniref:1-phosphatidylinositol 4,5-bisphosphate phosphodiesterase eta-2-like isoform X2 n=1 Tax=Paramacrobiotus metropolitanus TaxID=2943436 RepID=UPI002445AD5F|nr:1-phosphatidylinositol 4,5-bisphosphate phosphodiesterase eta-2-like isoform X2 [Paramacrobiotus metropolitanus]
MDRDQRPNRPVGRGNPRFFAPPVAGNQAYRPMQRIAAPNVQNVQNADTRALHDIQDGHTLLKLGSHRTYRRTYCIDNKKEYLCYCPLRKWICFSRSEYRQVDLDEVKEVRAGYSTDGFNRREKSARFVRKYPEDICFSIVLSSGKALDLIAPDKDVCDKWINVMRRLIDEKQQVEREKRLEMWLRKSFVAADRSADGLLNFEECMTLMDRLNLKISRQQAMEIFQAAGTTRTLSGLYALDMKGFHRFYLLLSERPELKDIFRQYISELYDFWTVNDLKNFLFTEQEARDDKCDPGPSLVETCEWMIQTFEPIQENRDNKLLSLSGFRDLMLSSRLGLFNPDFQAVYQDMTQPLQNYYIASSHNTYLLDKQLVGATSIEGYISAILTGCRCLELDCWDGPDGEPMITHGFTLTTKMEFKHALKAIKSYAFINSDYPLILSLENHCSVKQQRRMAEYLKDILKEQLFVGEKESADMNNLPSPEQLRNCVLLAAKKLPPGAIDDAEFYEVKEGCVSDQEDDSEMSFLSIYEPFTDESDWEQRFAHYRVKFSHHEKDKRRKFQIAKAFSDCVFIKEGEFRGFLYARDDGKYYRMDNIAEPNMRTLVSNMRDDFVRHCSQHLVRIYPAGIRTDSSNMNPIPAMDAGCQIVAFNYQDKSKETQIYRAFFGNNGGCGYILKPEHMRNITSAPGESRRMQLTVRVISAQQLPKLPVAGEKEISDPFVVVEIYGCPEDCEVMATVPVKNNGFNPVWNKEFSFDIRNVDLAVLRFEIRDMDYRSRCLIAQYNIPVACVQRGYHHVNLLGPDERKLDLSTLFVQIKCV